MLVVRGAIMEKQYLAIDIGASSGRAMIVTYLEHRISYYELHRFKNIIYEKDQKLFWDFKHLMREINFAIDDAISKYPQLKSVGIDTWGVDYGYIDYDLKLIEDPRCYRDIRNKDAFLEVYKHITKENLYKKTGIQYLPFNTIYQLQDDLMHEDSMIAKAKHILLIPDLIAFHLTHTLATDITNASTTNLLDAKTKTWITGSHLDHLIHKFPPFIKPGQCYGYIEKHNLPVIATCSHDTASAFASISKVRQQAIISSGTWSLIGILLQNPILSKKSYNLNFTNELGYLNQTRYLKNVMGLWIINQIKEDLHNDGLSYDYVELEKLAMSSTPFAYFLDPDDPMFIEKGHMINRVKTYFVKTNQKETHDIKHILRAVYEGLAFKYRMILDDIEILTKKKINEIIIIGGGNQSCLLNQFTANLTKRHVIIGPTEASVLGNALLQMIYFNDVSSAKEGHNIILKSIQSRFITSEFNDYEYAYQLFVNHMREKENHG